MKRHLVLSLFLFCILLVQNSCKCDCSEPVYSVKLKLIKDGHNALFGPDASINKDSIRFFRLDLLSLGYSDDMNFTDSTIELQFQDRFEYIFKIGNIRLDTITGTAMITNTQKCGCCGCPSQLTSVKMNGQVICQNEGCSDIIEIQL